MISRHPGTQRAELIHGGRTGGPAARLGPQTLGFLQMNGRRAAWKPGTRQLSAKGRAGQGAELRPRAVSGPRALGLPPSPPAPALPGRGSGRARASRASRTSRAGTRSRRGRTARRGRGWGPGAAERGRRGDPGQRRGRLRPHACLVPRRLPPTRPSRSTHGPGLTSRAASEQKGGGEHQQEKQQQAAEGPHGAVAPASRPRPRELSAAPTRMALLFIRAPEEGRGTHHARPSPRPFPTWLLGPSGRGARAAPGVT